MERRWKFDGRTPGLQITKTTPISIHFRHIFQFQFSITKMIAPSGPGRSQEGLAEILGLSEVRFEVHF